VVRAGAGDDYVQAGPITGNPGRDDDGIDRIVCGPGHDTVEVTPANVYAPDCEVIKAFPR
jgi:hypothetical protein